MAPIQQLSGFLELALFAGGGGGILAGHLLGFRCVGAVEIEPFPRDSLIRRQDDGALPPFPVWDDIRSFTVRNNACRPYLRALRRLRGQLVISGGFPCQDISCAGKGAGIDGERSGLWGEMFRVVCEVGPRFVFVENSPMLTSRGLGRVLGDLASVGYDAEWTVLGACDAGAPHRRERIWILAHPADSNDETGFSKVGFQERAQLQLRGGRGAEDMADAYSHPAQGMVPGPQPSRVERPAGLHHRTGGAPTGWWESEPDVGGVADGLAPGLDIHGAASAGDVGRVATGIQDRVGRLKSLGNGQVPEAARTAFLHLLERFLSR